MDQQALFSDTTLREKDGEVLGMLRTRASTCTDCNLHKGRTNSVFGEGNLKPKVVFIGESPGGPEDASGHPFQGPAGEMLDKMMARMGLPREDTYLMNVVCCRPPIGSMPSPEDALACQPFCFGQLRVLRPQVIITLGSLAATSILRKQKFLHELRGKWWKWEDIPVRPTYHPNYLIKNPKERNVALVDLEAAVRYLQTGATSQSKE